MQLGARRKSVENLIYNDFEIAKNIGGDFLIVCFIIFIKFRMSM